MTMAISGVMIIGMLGIGLAVGGVAKAAAPKKGAVVSGVPNAVVKTNGVQIMHANASQFTPEAWAIIQSLSKKATGSTVSSLKSGQAVHKGFMVTKRTGTTIKGVGKNGSDWFMDAFDGTTIFELKPNNPVGIKQGIAQLHRYNNAMGGNKFMVLVLY